MYQKRGTATPNLTQTGQCYSTQWGLKAARQPWCAATKGSGSNHRCTATWRFGASHPQAAHGCLEELPGLVLLVLIEFLDDPRRFRLRRRLSGGHHCIDDDAGSVITIRGSISYRIYVQLCISSHSREGRVTFPEKAAERTAKSFFVVNAEETLRY